MFAIGEKINRYVQNELPASVADEFAGLELDITVEPITHPEFVFFQLPLTTNFQWDVVQDECQREHYFAESRPPAVPLRGTISVKGEVVAVGSLETPAGSFEETYQIEYQTEITHTLFSEAETTQQNQTVWFAPHVGIVKIEDERGVTELIAYNLASTAQN